MGAQLPPRVLIQGNTALFSSAEAAFTQHDGTGLAGRLDDMRVLAAYYLENVRLIVLRKDSSMGHHAPGWARLKQAVLTFNALLRSRGLDPIQLKRIRPGTPSHQLLENAFPTAPESTARRALLGEIGNNVVALVSEEQESEGDPLALIQSVGAEHPLFAAVPVLNPDKCTGCGGCIRVCPTGSLTLINEGAGAFLYRVRSETCTGCGLCVDICDVDAIELREMATGADDLPFDQSQCRACGVPFHEPHGRATSDECPVCRATGHHKKLFQVLH